MTENIEQFKTDNALARAAREEQEAIIRRFDEVISMKASHVTLKNFQDAVNDRISVRLGEIMNEVKEAMSALQGVERKQLEFVRNLEETMDEKIAEQARRERNKHTLASQKASAISAADGLAALKSMLQMKADQSDLERLYEVKINRVDFENMLDVQGVMSKQLKHVMVLMIELIGCMQGKAQDTTQSRNKRIENLIKQVQSFTNWVLAFEPVEFMNAADATSMRPTNKLDEAQFKEYSARVLGEFQPSKT